MKSFLTRLFKLLAPAAYLALVFAACVQQNALAIPFFAFFAPVGVLCTLLLFGCVALLAVGRLVDPEGGRESAQKWLAEIRAQSGWMRAYGFFCSFAELIVLIATLHPFYAASIVGAFIASRLLEKLLASF